MSKNATIFDPFSRNIPQEFRSMAGKLMACESLSEFRAMAPLPKDAQELIDDAVVRVGLDRLVVVQDLISEGLVKPLPNWLGVPELYWEKVNKSGHAQRTMTPRTRGEGNLPDREGTRIPIYITMDNFDIGVRELRASQRAGASLETSGIEQATRRVNEAIEDAAINGGPTVGGNASPGLLNAPNVNTYTYVGNEKWDAAGKTGEEIVDDVVAMADTLRADRMYGPYNLYVSTTYGNHLNKNYTSSSSDFDITIRERLERMTFGGRNLRIREADQLEEDTTILVQMTSDVIDVVVGDEPMPVSWEDGPSWTFHHAIMACIVPRVKDTYDNQSGICVGQD